MAIRKKIVRRKRLNKKRNYRKRKMVMYATPRMVYKISLQAKSSILTIPAGAHFAYEFEPSLSDLVTNDLNAFQELYDEFKITGFKWRLIPDGNNANVNFTSDVLGSSVYDNIGIQYYSVLDNTDTEPLTTPDEALEYRNCRIHQSWKKASRYCPASVPRLTKDVNNNPLLVTQKPSWMQIKSQPIGGTTYNNKNVAHVGCKLFFELNPNSTDINLNLYITLMCQFRNKK